MKQFTGFTKGINLGGWISQCGKNYNDAHYSSFITKKDIEVIAGWGVDHVRLPFDYNVIQDDNGDFIESGFKYINDAIAWCEEYGLNVVLDLHKTCGYVFDDESYCSFFTNEQLQNQFIKLWVRMATDYGNKENIAFELLNEVTAPETAKPWNEIIKKTIPEIRKIAPTTKIIVGGIFNSSLYGLTLLDEPYDENVVFTFHCYSPFVFTHQNAGWVPKTIGYHSTFPMTYGELKSETQRIFGHDFDSEFQEADDKVVGPEYFTNMFKTAIDISEKFNVPMYCGEYGVIDQADLESTVRWYETMHAALESTNMARSAWTYKLMDFGISSEHYADVYDKLIKLL